MPTSVPTYVRLEPFPRETNLQEGFAAALDNNDDTATDAVGGEADTSGATSHGSTST